MCLHVLICAYMCLHVILGARMCSDAYVKGKKQKTKNHREHDSGMEITCKKIKKKRGGRKQKKKYRREHDSGMEHTCDHLVFSLVSLVYLSLVWLV